MAFGSLVPLSSSPASAQAELSEGPKNLVITYRADPQRRAQFRQFLATEQAAKLRRLKAEGKIADFRILFSWYAQPRVWDALIELRFRDADDIAQWNRIERTMPGGLSPAGLALGQPVLTSAADLSWSGGDTHAKGADQGVYYVIPYEYKDVGEYRDYAQTYVIPQYEGWLKAGLLQGYEMLLNRYTVGDPWDVLVILQYRDIHAFGQRQQILTKVRETLRSNPEWQAYHEKKGDIRSETENSIADLIGQ